MPNPIRLDRKQDISTGKYSIFTIDFPARFAVEKENLSGEAVIRPASFSVSPVFKFQ